MYKQREEERGGYLNYEQQQGNGFSLTVAGKFGKSLICEGFLSIAAR